MSGFQIHHVLRLFNLGQGQKIACRLDFAIRRFDPSRPSQAVIQSKVVVNLCAKTLYFVGSSHIYP